MNLIHNDVEPRTFDLQSTTLVVTSKVPLLQLDSLHQQHFGPTTLPLTQCFQLFMNLDQLTLQCEVHIQESGTFPIHPYLECTTQLKLTTNALEIHNG
jgi:hypothetical protein